MADSQQQASMQGLGAAPASTQHTQMAPGGLAGMQQGQGEVEWPDFGSLEEQVADEQMLLHYHQVLFLCFPSLLSVFPPGQPPSTCARAVDGFAVPHTAMPVGKRSSFPEALGSDI
jgi:hypothetical protein